MNIEEYISSGILEAYALNDLSAQEMREVEELMVKYPELKEELTAIELAFESMAMSTQIAPKAELKSSILDAIEAPVEEKEESPKIVKTAPEKEAKVVQMKSSPVWKYTVAASICLALISGYLAYDYRTKWKASSQAYAQLMASNQQMADQYNQVNQKLEDLENDLGIFANPEFTRITMPGTDNAKDALASVYWNQTTEELYLDIQRLQTLSAAQQYQLWAIVDGQPVDLGVFDWNEEGLVKMKNISNSAAFAVTIEPKGGSENPSLETMQVLGSV